MSWTDQFVGIPYGQFNCWALVRHVLREQFGVTVPSYDGDYADEEEAAEIADLIYRERSHWIVIGHGLSERQRFRAGDVIHTYLLRPREPSHVGVIVDAERMLHTRAKTGSIIEHYTKPFWSRRVVGVYRHPELAG